MKELETISPYHRRMLKREVKKEKQLSRDEGRTFEARNLIQRIGTKRFGPLNTPTEERLNSITALEELEKLADRLTEVESWTELLTL